MATTHNSQSILGALDTAVGGASLNNLLSGNYCSPGAAINNTPTDGTTISYDMADLTITLSSAVTTGAGSAYIVVFILPSVDGTNYPIPPGTSAVAAPLHLSYTFDQIVSVSTSTIVCPNIPIPPSNFKVQIQNVLGVALPATNTSTCQIMRKTTANW